MRYRLSGLAVVAGVGVFAAAAGLLSPAGAAGVPAPGAAAGAPRQVLLVNGDRVLMGAAGGPEVILPPVRSGGVPSVVALRLAGRAYDIPAAALPFVGRGLDLRLFSVRRLMTAERGGRLPVQVSYRNRVPVLPGVTVTRASGGTAEGYLTADSARVFSAALSRLARADHRTGRYGTDGMFAGGTAVRLAGTAVAEPARPAFTMHTLTVDGTNLAGKPDTGDTVVVVDVDNSNRTDPLTAAGDFYHGQAKFSLAAGHYYALAIFGTGADVSRVVAIPQFTVAGNSPKLTVHETAANNKITMVTPRPAKVLDTDLRLHRTARTGSSIDAEFVAGNPLWVNRTRARPSVGTIQESVNQHLESPPGQEAPYEYTLSYTSAPGVIGGQRYVVRPQDLATLDERIYQPVTSTGEWAFSGAFPNTDFGALWPAFVEPAGPALRLPGHLIEYAGGTDLAHMIWFGQYNPIPGQEQSMLGFNRRLRPGEHLIDNLGAFPVHPGPDVLPADTRMKFNIVTPSAVRSGNTLRLEVYPFDDNQPGDQVGGFNTGPGHEVSGRYQIDLNGKEVAGGAATPPFRGYPDVTASAPLGASPATVRFSLDLTRSDNLFPLSAATHTVWSWRTAPLAGARLPQGWSCVPFTRGRNCAGQPMMTLWYHVARMSLTGSVPAGRQVIRLQVGHLQLARPAQVKAASVQVSFDSGKTWHQAHVTGRSGNFTATFTAPAGAKVSLRTAANDAVGGHISETILSAYQVAS